MNRQPSKTTEKKTPEPKAPKPTSKPQEAPAQAPAPVTKPKPVKKGMIDIRRCSNVSFGLSLLVNVKIAFFIQ